MEIKNLNREGLMALAQETYDKEHWSHDDVYTLRAWGLVIARDLFHEVRHTYPELAVEFL
jgi:hypothetical protein